MLTLVYVKNKIPIKKVRGNGNNRHFLKNQN